jgi:hypothetical protein
MTPREVTAAANRAGQVVVGAAVERIEVAGSTKTRPEFPPVIHARLGAGIRLEQPELTPAFLATLKHAASMKNPLFMSGSGCGSPPGECRSSCAASRRPWTAGSSCPAA